MQRRTTSLAVALVIAGTSLVTTFGTLVVSGVRPADAQTTYTNLASLEAAFGDDPRATDSRLRIPSLGIDAAVGRHAVTADVTVSPNPYGPGDVAFYDYAHPAFGGWPGGGQNTVLSGHVNYRALVSYAGAYYQGAGVFARLDELRPGDVIEITRAGRTVRFAVSWWRLIGDDYRGWEQAITSDVPIESVTLYTCDGIFDAATRTYSDRYVVRAELLRGKPNRFAAPLGGPFSVGTSGTTHPVALAEAQRFPVRAIYGRDEQGGEWLTYRPGAPAFANTLFGHLREDSFVIIQFR